MRVIPPLEITDAMLVSSNVLDVAPAYASGTTYTANANVVTGAVGKVLTVWRSLQNTNTNHNPSTSPTWWTEVSHTYSAYDPAVSYVQGDRVISNTSHRVYESQLEGANLGQPLTTGTAWLDVGPTNRWASFDQLRNTQTLASVDITQTIQLVDRVDSIAVVGIDGASVRIEMKVAGVTKYDITVNLVTRRTLSWKQYFYGKFTTRSNVQFFDLPPYRNATITVTVSKPTAGTRGVGGIFLGTSVYLGRTQYEAVSEDLNFSIIERNDFGDIKLVPRRSIPKIDVEVYFDKPLTAQITAVRKLLNARPAVWSGLDDFNMMYFEPLFVYGVYKEFSLNLKDFDEGRITLEVEEM